MNEFEFKREVGNFLDEESKKLKQKIMEDLFSSFYGNIQHNGQFLMQNPQALGDLTTSILVMFTREILVHYISAFNLEGERKDILKAFFETIKDQVNDRVKKSMQ